MLVFKRQHDVNGTPATDSQDCHQLRNRQTEIVDVLLGLVKSTQGRTDEGASNREVRRFGVYPESKWGRGQAVAAATDG